MHQTKLMKSTYSTIGMQKESLARTLLKEEVWGGPRMMEQLASREQDPRVIGKNTANGAST